MKLIILNLAFKLSLKRFSINLQNGPGDQAHNIPLHFSVRFDDPYSGTVVVRNNKRGGGWGNEERDAPHFPFIKGNAFEILVLVEHHEFKVILNSIRSISRNIY